MKKLLNNRKGITLVELILALGIMVIIIQITYSIFLVGDKSFKIGRDIGFAQQDGRLISDYINRELRSVKNIYDNVDDLDESYYELSIDEDGNLIRKKYEYNESTDSFDEIDNKKITSNVVSIVFSYPLNGIDGGPNKGLLNINTTSKEANQDFNLSFDILLENYINFKTVITADIISNTIKYTKYE